MAADSFGDKFKEFFGFGEVESYEDPYYRDSFEERSARHARTDEREEDPRTHRDGAREPREPLTHDAGRGASRGDYGRYRTAEYGVESAEREPREPRRAPSTVGAREVAQPKREPIVVRLSLNEYNQAKEIAETLKAGDVVVFNLGGMEKSVATRVLDFAAGVSIGLDAQLKKLGGIRNFVLIPQGITLEQSQLDQLAEG